MTDLQTLKDEHVQELRDAFIAGCRAVHENYQPDPDPEFGEAGDDYAASIAHTAITALIGRLERAEAAMLQVIDARDAAEEALSQAYYLVTGRSPEWSNLFGRAEALTDIEDACDMLRLAVRTKLGLGQ